MNIPLVGTYLKLGDSLWVEVIKQTEYKRTDSFDFEVINGQWIGRFDMDLNRIYVKYTGKYIDMTITKELTRKEVFKECGYGLS